MSLGRNVLMGKRIRKVRGMEGGEEMLGKIGEREEQGRKRSETSVWSSLMDRTVGMCRWGREWVRPEL